MIEIINNSQLNNIISEAQSSVRKRKNHNYHKTFSDPINRMLNAIEPGSYIQPHKHEDPDKREIFLLLKGKLAVVFFNNAGKPVEHVILENKENYGVEISPSVWHTIIALETGTVVYEIKDGPYSVSDDKNFADWAPKEGDDNCREYLHDILSQLNLS